MSVEKTFIAAFVLCLILAAICMLWGRSRKRRDETGDDWARQDRRMRTYEDEQFTRQLHAMNTERLIEPPTPVPGKGALPTADARTESLAKLGAATTRVIDRETHEAERTRHADEPDYGWKTRPGEGRVRSDIPSQLPVKDDYITGEIVKITHTPSGMIERVMEEFEQDWHWLGGELHAPRGLVSRLPEGDWLRELLVAA